MLTYDNRRDVVAQNDKEKKIKKKMGQTMPARWEWQWGGAGADIGFSVGACARRRW